MLPPSQEIEALLQEADEIELMMPFNAGMGMLWLGKVSDYLSSRFGRDSEYYKMFSKQPARPLGVATTNEADGIMRFRKGKQILKDILEEVNQEEYRGRSQAIYGHLHKDDGPRKNDGETPTLQPPISDEADKRGSLGRAKRFRSKRFLISLGVGVVTFIVIMVFFYNPSASQGYRLVGDSSAFTIDNNRNSNTIYADRLFVPANSSSMPVKMSIGDIESENVIMDLEIYHQSNREDQLAVLENVKSLVIESDVVGVASEGMMSHFIAPSISVPNSESLVLEGASSITTVARVGNNTFNIGTGDAKIYIDGKDWTPDIILGPKFIQAHITVSGSDAPIYLENGGIVSTSNWERLELDSYSFPFDMYFYHPEGRIGISEPYEDISLNGAANLSLDMVKARTTIENNRDARAFHVDSEGSSSKILLNDKPIQSVLTPRFDYVGFAIAIAGSVVSSVLTAVITKKAKI